MKGRIFKVYLLYSVFFIKLEFEKMGNMFGKIFEQNKLSKGCKIIFFIVGILALSFVIKSVVVFLFAYIMDKNPGENISGIENYDKESLYEEYGSDLDSEMLIFPENTEKMLVAEYEASLKSGVFDTVGYIVLQAKYEDAEYKREIERISRIECEVSDIILGVRYDEKNYKLPAYVAMDGFCNVYEYALIDDEKCEITYVILSYPDVDELAKYKECLKTDTNKYKEEVTWDRYSIYARHFEDGEYVEYSDEE